MPQPEWMINDIAALRAIDMSAASSNNFPLKIFVISKDADYIYDPLDTNADNGEWIVEPGTGNGDGAWHPTDEIFGTTLPTGSSKWPVRYCQYSVTSTGNVPQNIYRNAGGGSSQWRNEFIG